MLLACEHRIENQKIFLAGEEPRPAPHHLCHHHAAARRPQNQHTIDRRFIIALSQQARIAQEPDIIIRELAQDIVPVRTGPIDMFSPQPLPLQSSRPGSRRIAKRAERQNFAVCIIPGNHFSQLIKHRLQRIAKPALGKIAHMRLNRREIDLDRQRLHPHISKIRRRMID